MLPTALLAAFALFQGATPPAKPAPEAVLATIDGAPVTAAEIEPYLWAWKSREVVTEFVNYRMILAEAAKKGLSVTEAEVQAKVDSQLANVKGSLGPGETIETFLQSRGYSPSRLALASRSALLVDKLVGADFKIADYVKADTLLFPTHGDTTDVLGKAIKSADAAYAMLLAGKTWDAVVKANTTPPNAIAQGGPLGWQPMTSFPEGVRAGIAALKSGGYTKPVQTGYGIQIFRLTAHGTEATPAEVETLKTNALAAGRAALIQKLRQATKIEIK